MGHGAPDNYQVRQTGVNYFLQDDAELAIRLRGISSIDRLGNVLWCDDFSNGEEHWGVELSGTGAAKGISGVYTLSGGFSMKLTGGSSVDRYARSYIYLPYPEPSKMGFEVCSGFNSDVDYIDFTLVLYALDSFFIARVRLDIQNNILKVLHSDGTYYDIVSGLNLTAISSPFYILKFVVDFVNEKYVRARFNGASYNLSDYAVQKIVAPSSQVLFVGLDVYSVLGANGISYIDSVIITRDEP